MGKYQDPDTRRLLWCTQDERVCFWEDDCLPWRNNEATQQWYNKATQQWFRELQVPIVATATQTSVSNRRWLWVDTSDGQPRWGPSLVLADLPSETPQVPQSVLGYISQGHSSSPPSPSFSPAVHALLVVVCDERTPRHLQFVASLGGKAQAIGDTV